MIIRQHCKVHLLEVNEPSANKNNSEKDVKEIATDLPPVHEVSPHSPPPAEVIVDLCPVVPRQTESSGHPGSRSQAARHRQSNQKKPSSIMYLIPVEAHRSRQHRTIVRKDEATSHADPDSNCKGRRTILRSQSTPALIDRSEKFGSGREASQPAAKVSFAADTKPVSQSIAKQSEGKVLLINDNGRTVAHDQIHASMQLLMKYTKELEGKRLRNERLRQKNSLHFGYQALRWMAISHSVVFICASVIILALLKG